MKKQPTSNNNNNVITSLSFLQTKHVNIKNEIKEETQKVWRRNEELLVEQLGIDFPRFANKVIFTPFLSLQEKYKIFEDDEESLNKLQIIHVTESSFLPTRYLHKNNNSNDSNVCNDDNDSNREVNNKRGNREENEEMEMLIQDYSSCKTNLEKQKYHIKLVCLIIANLFQESDVLQFIDKEFNHYFDRIPDMSLTFSSFISASFKRNIDFSQFHDKKEIAINQKHVCGDDETQFDDIADLNCGRKSLLQRMKKKGRISNKQQQQKQRQHDDHDINNHVSVDVEENDNDSNIITAKENGNQELAYCSIIKRLTGLNIMRAINQSHFAFAVSSFQQKLGISHFTSNLRHLIFVEKEINDDLCDDDDDKNEEMQSINNGKMRITHIKSEYANWGSLTWHLTCEFDVIHSPLCLSFVDFSIDKLQFSDAKYEDELLPRLKNLISPELMILQFRELSLFNEGIDDLQFEIMIGKYLEMKNSPHNDGDNDDDKKLQPIIEKVNCDYNRLSWFSDRFLFISDNLTELSIINNQFTEFPLIITRVPNLRILSIGMNEIKEIPDEIGNLRKLEELRCSNNKISVISENIGLLSELKIITLSTNPIHSIPFFAFLQLQNLQTLSLFNTPLADRDHVQRFTTHDSIHQYLLSNLNSE